MSSPDVFPEQRLNQRQIALLAGGRSAEWACDAIRRGEFGGGPDVARDGQDYLVRVSAVNRWFAARCFTPSGTIRVKAKAA